MAVGSPKMPDSGLEIGMGKSVTDTVKLSHNHILFGMNRDDSPASYGANAADPECMLVALHENASTCYLYRGSRGVIDGLLNKTMIQAINSPFGASTWMGYFFSFLEVVQLVAMTYVAAQKGWDGVALLALVVVAWAFDSVVYTDDKMAALWLRREGVTMKARNFRFSGRTPMLGAIQLLSRSRIIS